MNSLPGALRHFAKIMNGTTPASANEDYWNGDVQWATPEDLGKLSGNRISQTKRQVAELAVKETNLSVLPTESVLLSTRAPIGHMAINDSPMAFNQGCRGLIPGEKAYSPYLFYLLKSRVAELNAIANGTTFTELSRNDLASIIVEFPPLDTQKRIAQFLDEKTAKIDGLIEKKRELLGRLAEKRQALITQAVTKGLNPDAPMKPSGIEWLGDIPEHWEAMPIKRVINHIEQGWSPSAEEREAGPDEWGVLKSGCVNEGIFQEQSHKTLPAHLEPREHLEVHTDDILMCRASGSVKYIGSVALIPNVRPKLMFSDKTYRITLADHLVDTAFFVYSMASKPLREQIVLSVSGAEGLANNIAQSSVGQYMHCFPPKDEQKIISDFLARQLIQIDDVKIAIEASIGLLSEHRAAIITSAVTGRIVELI